MVFDFSILFKKTPDLKKLKEDMLYELHQNKYQTFILGEGIFNQLTAADISFLFDDLDLNAIQTLDLSNNSLKRIEKKLLLLRPLLQNNKLLSLKLQNMELGATQAVELTQLIKGTTIEQLDLAGNNLIYDKGIALNFLVMFLPGTNVQNILTTAQITDEWGKNAAMHGEKVANPLRKVEYTGKPPAPEGYPILTAALNHKQDVMAKIQREKIPALESKSPFWP